jgi:hypothetical protein
MLTFGEATMTEMRSRSGTLVGLAAAVGAFGAAVMMSAATAPTARADDLTEIINAVDGDFTAGQGAFTTAFEDFGSSDLAPGLTSFFEGVDDDALAAPNNLLVGSVEALANEKITGDQPVGLFVPGSFSQGLTIAESFFSTGESYLTSAAADLGTADYGDAALYDLVGSDYVSIVPLEELLLGAVASF